jgi:flagellar biosynthesis/type III secretory pathway M-ring protein FliF/YscJ
VIASLFYWTGAAVWAFWAAILVWFVVRAVQIRRDEREAERRKFADVDALAKAAKMEARTARYWSNIPEPPDEHEVHIGAA